MTARSAQPRLGIVWLQKCSCSQHLSRATGYSHCAINIWRWSNWGWRRGIWDRGVRDRAAMWKAEPKLKPISDFCNVKINVHTAVGALSRYIWILTRLTRFCSGNRIIFPIGLVLIYRNPDSRSVSSDRCWVHAPTPFS